MSNEDLLKLLEAHGQQFLQFFDTPVVLGKRKDVPEKAAARGAKKKKVDADLEEEEWEGIKSDTSSEEEDDSEDVSEDGIGDEDEGEEDEDDDFTYESHSHQPDVVVFSEANTSSTVLRQSKSGFMSSKVTKLTQDAPSSSQKKAVDDEDDDLTNAQNDALLHRLVHTQLLSGSLNPDLDLTPAQRKKALAGRIMEAAGKVKLGKGEAAVRKAEHNRAAKHVRDGLFDKQKERQQKQLEEAKQLGNYHPRLKALYDTSTDSKPHHRKRERGMKMGIGSFQGGILKLGKNEISAIEGRGVSSRGRGRGGRGRGRGRGGKR